MHPQRVLTRELARSRILPIPISPATLARDLAQPQLRQKRLSKTLHPNLTLSPQVAHLLLLLPHQTSSPHPLPLNPRLSPTPRPPTGHKEIARQLSLGIPQPRTRTHRHQMMSLLIPLKTIVCSRELAGASLLLVTPRTSRSSTRIPTPRPSVTVCMAQQRRQKRWVLLLVSGKARWRKPWALHHNVITNVVSRLSLFRPEHSTHDHTTDHDHTTESESMEQVNL